MSMSDKQKPPAYQWYPKDYESDEAVRLMTYEQEGIYRRLLDHQALHGSIPADTSQIALLVPKVPRQRFLKLWPLIASKFPVGDDGRLVNRRLERARVEWAEYVDAKKAAGRKSVDARRLKFGSAQPNKPPNTAPNGDRTDVGTQPEPPTATATAKEHERARDDGSALERVTDAFRAHWKRVYGHESTLTLNHLQIMQLDQQVEKIGEAKFLAAMVAFFATDDQYVRKSKHPLGLLLRDPARFLATEASVRSSGTLSPEETRDAQRRLREQAS
jgi:uncharacterized protein YdaU (DUF1376 family)